MFLPFWGTEKRKEIEVGKRLRTEEHGPHGSLTIQRGETKGCIFDALRGCATCEHSDIIRNEKGVYMCGKPEREAATSLTLPCWNGRFFLQGLTFPAFKVMPTPMGDELWQSSSQSMTVLQQSRGGNQTTSNLRTGCLFGEKSESSFY